MFIIGNSDTSSRVPMWAQVIGMLRSSGALGPKLPLCCPQHQATTIEVQEPNDFLLLAPEGGCDLKCDMRLGCGHPCTYQCHSPRRHDSVICQKPCERHHKEWAHLCTKRCGDECGTCTVPVKNVTLSCGHIKKVLPCHQTLNLDNVHCETKVEVTGPCGHVSMVPCGTDPAGPKYQCSATCSSVLACGHACQQPCFQCCKRKEDGSRVTTHGPCSSKCGRQYNTCQHACTAPCHGEQPCPLCSTRCDVRCHHNRCGKTCIEPCAPCTETCGNGCQHQGFCNMPCAVPCDILPCSRRCEKVLRCGHRCPSLCGEKCPEVKFCQSCGKEDIRNMMVDYVELSTYRDCNLDEEPCIFPDCGHIMTVASMDGQMSIPDHYQLGTDGSIVGLRRDGSKPLTETIKGCPQCRGSLRNIVRYNRVVKRALLDESTKKFMTWSNAQFVPLAAELSAQEDRLTAMKTISMAPARGAHRTWRNDIHITGNRGGQIETIRNLSGLGPRLGPLLQLRTKIASLLQQVRIEEQPFARVEAMATASAMETGNTSSFTFDVDVLQTRAGLLCGSQLLQCDYDILSDLHNISQKHKQRDEIEHGWLKMAVLFNTTHNRRDCLALAAKAGAKKQPMIVIQARILFAKFVALERLSPGDGDKRPQILAEAKEQLKQASLEVHAYPSCAMMGQEIEEAEKMIREETFYTQVTSDEMRAVYSAMAQDFSGTGHWYYCENRHLVNRPQRHAQPFSIG